MSEQPLVWEAIDLMNHAGLIGVARYNIFQMSAQPLVREAIDLMDHRGLLGVTHYDDDDCVQGDFVSFVYLYCGLIREQPKTP